MSVDVSGKVVLVTGANRGIGKAIVEEALQRGAKKFMRRSAAPSRLCRWSNRTAKKSQS